jgi:hypothetical protein
MSLVLTPPRPVMKLESSESIKGVRKVVEIAAPIPGTIPARIPARNPVPPASISLKLILYLSFCSGISTLFFREYKTAGTANRPANMGMSMNCCLKPEFNVTIPSVPDNAATITAFTLDFDSRIMKKRKKSKM